MKGKTKFIPLILLLALVLFYFVGYPKNDPYKNKAAFAIDRHYSQEDASAGISEEEYNARISMEQEEAKAQFDKEHDEFLKNRTTWFMHNPDKHDLSLALIVSLVYIGAMLAVLKVAKTNRGFLLCFALATIILLFPYVYLAFFNPYLTH